MEDKARIDISVSFPDHGPTTTQGIPDLAPFSSYAFKNCITRPDLHIKPPFPACGNYLSLFVTICSHVKTHTVLININWWKRKVDKRCVCLLALEYFENKCIYDNSLHSLRFFPSKFFSMLSLLFILIRIDSEFIWKLRPGS